LDVAELDYDLPPGLVAQAPLPERDASRLLVLDRCSGAVRHAAITDLPSLVPPSLLVVNDTRVIPARLFGTKATGGRAQLLLVERLSPPGAVERWTAMGRASKGLRPGTVMSIGGGAMQARIVERRGDGEIEVELRAEPTVDAALAAHGHVPLPPYIARAPDASDRERYQTVFAAHDGAVAAPTAGLHLSQRLLSALREAGHHVATVTLHVGPGTFAPIRSATLEGHTMHAERFDVPEATASAIATAKREGRPVLAIGTTVVRTLESITDARGEVRAGPGSTSIFLYPPCTFRCVDALLTNFHLPGSTLLALVMAFSGVDHVRHAYTEAVAARYRFFSYGDAMLVACPPP
jgi:S-adenosylmethionine:tRNA ribosyltransferase-isomerase